MAKNQVRQHLSKQKHEKVNNEAGIDPSHLALAQILLAQKTIQKKTAFKLPATVTRKLSEDPEIIKKRQMMKEAALKEVINFFH